MLCKPSQTKIRYFATEQLEEIELKNEASSNKNLKKKRIIFYFRNNFL